MKKENLEVMKYVAIISSIILGLTCFQVALFPAPVSSWLI